MSRFRGLEVDDLGLWSEYCEFPNVDLSDQYLPLVVCPNPDHETTKRHFQVNQRDGLVHCFTYCGISGNYQHAISIAEGCSEREARKIILKHTRGTRRKGKVVKRSVARAVRDIPTASLEYETYIPEAGIKYLSRRGISANSIAKWGIGFDSSELRIIIPGKDVTGQTRLLIKRAIKENDWPKYLYTEGYPKTSLLFGACYLNASMVKSQGIVLVEGSLDAIRLHQHGINVAAATLGTGLAESQSQIIERLRPRKIYLFFDKDVAGIASLEISARQLRGKYPIYIVRFPKQKTDPAECTRREVERAIDRAIPLRSFKRNVKSRGKGISVG